MRSAAPAHRTQLSGGPGRPVPDTVRARMEAAFGADFSTVTVREGNEPAAVGALALTRGEAITLRPGAGETDTQEGVRLLGHELAHVVQQRTGRVGGAGLTEDPALEAEADEAGDRAARGEPAAVAVPAAASPSGVAGAGAQPKRNPDRTPAAAPALESVAGQFGLPEGMARSFEPAQENAISFAQGPRLARGEPLVPHEAAHVRQQRSGRVPQV